MSRLNRSFSARLSFYIIVMTAALFALSFSIYFFSLKKTIIDNAYNTSNLELENIIQEIDYTFSRVEQSIFTILAEVENDIDNPDAMTKHIRNILNTNPIISGSCVAFKANFYPSKGKLFMPYIHRVNDELVLTYLGRNGYNYLDMEWYKHPIEQNKSGWSQPYFDKGGGDIAMVTYTHLLHDKKGEAVGVISADVSLDWLSTLSDSLTFYSNSRIFLINDHGLHLVHEDKEKLMKESVNAAKNIIANDQADRVYKNIHTHKSGVRTFEDAGKTWFAFYAPIERLQWNVIIVSLETDVLSELHTATRIFWAIAIFAAIALYILSTLIIKKAVTPLTQFADSAATIAKGNFDAPLPEIKTEDELKLLRNSFVNLQDSLKLYIEELKTTTSLKERIESELSIAKDIQMGMLPKNMAEIQNNHKIDLNAFLKPAKEIGGDLYDFFVEGDKLFVFIGDVSGKGVPAALFMATTRSLLRAVMSLETSPSAAINRINNIIGIVNDQSMFVTCFLGILDIKTGVLNFCNAGHNPPVILPPNGDTYYLDVDSNVAVGLFEEYDYVEQRITIADGTKVIMYTDGIVEAEDINNKLYSEEKLIEALNSCGDCDADEIIDVIIKSVSQHVKDAPQSDDIATLVFGYNSQIEDNIIVLELENKMEEIGKIEFLILNTKEKFNVSTETASEIRLSIEETIVNTIMYGYNEGEKDTITVTIKKENNQLTIIIEDKGKAFDPTISTVNPDFNLSLEEMPIGGLGIFLVKNLMDSVIYDFVDGKNRLILTKTI